MNRRISMLITAVALTATPAIAQAQETWSDTAVWASAGTTFNNDGEQLAEAWITGVYPASKRIVLRGGYSATRGVTTTNSSFEVENLPTLDSFAVAVGYSGERFAFGAGVLLAIVQEPIAMAHGGDGSSGNTFFMPLPTFHARLGDPDGLFLSGEVLGNSPIFDIATVGIGYGFSGRGRVWLGGAFGLLPGLRISGEIPVADDLNIAPYLRVAGDADGNPNFLGGVGFTWRPK